MGTVKLLLGIFDKTLDHLPDFDQRRKKEYREAYANYSAELAKEPHERNDQRMLEEREKALLILQVYKDEVLG